MDDDKRGFDWRIVLSVFQLLLVVAQVALIIFTLNKSRGLDADYQGYKAALQGNATQQLADWKAQATADADVAAVNAAGSLVSSGILQSYQCWYSSLFPGNISLNLNTGLRQANVTVECVPKPKEITAGVVAKVVIENVTVSGEQAQPTQPLVQAVGA